MRCSSAGQPDMVSILNNAKRLIEHVDPIRVTGRVCEVTGLTVVAEGLLLPVGGLCEIEMRDRPAIESRMSRQRLFRAISAEGVDMRIPGFFRLRRQADRNGLAEISHAS